MSGPALTYAYRYAGSSEVFSAPDGTGLRIATWGGAEEHPRFFRGRLVRARRTADLLRALVEVVQSRFYLPPALLARKLALADPVVTSGGERLRFEAFSACCGVYARVDLLPQALDGEWLGRGTTNVDFNAPMRAALARIRDADDVTLAVGADAVELARGEEAIVERKVALPLRWLKGFVEVQAYQARMARGLELSGFEAARFLRGVPRGGAWGACWVLRAGAGLRMSQSAAAGGVRVAGIQRLHILDDVVRHARTVRVYADEATGACAWELLLDEARFHLVLSPEVSRGFSGEGQVLEALATRQWEPVLPRVRASLSWEAAIDAERLARDFELERDGVNAALAALGSRGLVGYDLAEGAYFHRVLPFDLEAVEALHPRLNDARRIVAGGGVRIVRQDDAGIEAYVQGTGLEHRVRMEGDDAKCSCPWYAKHQGERGPCKHVLAVQIVREGGE